MLVVHIIQNDREFKCLLKDWVVLKGIDLQTSSNISGRAYILTFFFVTNGMIGMNINI